MLRVVAEPGVLVSAVLTPSGPPADVVNRWREGEFDLVVSAKLLAELEEVLLRPKFVRYVSEHDVREYVAGLLAEARVATDPTDVPPLSPDPDDDYLFALAIAADADLIISGDAHLTELETTPVPVVTPREFVERLNRYR